MGWVGEYNREGMIFPFQTVNYISGGIQRDQTTSNNLDSTDFLKMTVIFTFDNMSSPCIEYFVEVILIIDVCAPSDNGDKYLDNYW